MNHVLSSQPTPCVFQSNIGTITGLSWSPNGKFLAAVSSRGMVAVYETTSGACVLSQKITNARLSAVAWSDQGRCLLLGSEAGVLSLLQISTRTLAVSATYPAPITHIAWSPNAVTQRFFVVTGQELKVFTQGRTVPHTLRYATPIQNATWSPSGQQVALVCADGLVEVWDTQTQRMTWHKAQHRAHPRHVSWDATGKLLALGTQDGTVEFQDLSGGMSGSVLPVLPLFRFPIQEVRWYEHGLVASSAGEMVFWKEEHPLKTPITPQQSTPVQTLALDPQGIFLATARQGLVAIAAL